MIFRDYQRYKVDGKVATLAEGRVSTARLLTKSDCVGFSLSVVTLEAGVVFDLWYKHHWETNCVVSGTAELLDLESGRSWDLNKNTVYCVGPSDRHRLRAKTDMLAISIFCPGTNGDEIHDEDGSYPPTGEVPLGQERMFVLTNPEMQDRLEKTPGERNKLMNLSILNEQHRVGILLSKLLVPSGQEFVLNGKYSNTANYVLAGEGILKNSRSETKYRLLPGTLFCTTAEETLAITAKRDLIHLSIFGMQK